MRSILSIASAKEHGEDLEDDELEALGRFELLSNLRPSWQPLALEGLLTLRCSPAAALLSASAASEHSGASSQPWSLWARPWALRCLSSSEVWAATMRECFEVGLMVGAVPAHIVERSESVARLGPRLVGMIESGSKRVRLVL